MVEVTGRGQNRHAVLVQSRHAVLAQRRHAILVQRRPPARRHVVHVIATCQRRRAADISWIGCGRGAARHVGVQRIRVVRRTLVARGEGTRRRRELLLGGRGDWCGSLFARRQGGSLGRCHVVVSGLGVGRWEVLHSTM